MRKALLTLLLFTAALCSAYAYELADTNEIGIVHGPLFGIGWLDNTSSVRQTDYRVSITGADYEANGFGVGYLIDLSIPADFKVDGSELTTTLYNPLMLQGGLGINYRLCFGDLFSLSFGLGLTAGYGVSIFNDSTADEAASYGLIRIGAYGAVSMRMRVLERLVLKAGCRVTAPFYTCYSTPAFPATAESTTFLRLFGVGIFPYFGFSYLY